MECSRQEYWSGLPFPSSGIIIMNIQDWFPLGWTGLIHIKLVAVHGTLKSFLQHHSSKHQILWHSAFFMARLSHSYLNTGKTTALTTGNFVGKVMSLLFNTLSRFVIAFLPRQKLQSPSAVILEPKKIKSCHCFYCFPIYLPWSDGTGCHDLCCLNVEF